MSQVVKEPERPSTVYSVVRELLYVSRAEARAGATKIIELDDGRSVTVVVPPNTIELTRIELIGQGQLNPKTGKRGSIEFQVVFDD
jgi:DnaJ-class molecular chaperone